MQNKEHNIAYIDGANLHNGVQQLTWDFDYGRFRKWLHEKYSVRQAYIFLGLIPRYKDLYTKLQEQGFKLIFKEVIYDKRGKAKGNCDTDIVVKAMQEAYEGDSDRVILVSSDGDYAPLVKFLLQKGKMAVVLSPYDTKKCSILLKRTGVKIAYIRDQRNVLVSQKEKAPDGDGTP
jgi:uncharacterized LabA/DUF88 family protein